MTDPFALGSPGGPDGPPGPDPDALDSDSLQARREAAEALLRATTGAVTYLSGVVEDDQQETRDRLAAAKALLGFSGVGTVTGRVAGARAGVDPLSGLMGLLDSRPTSRWGAAAVGRQRCPEPSCDWPAHRGGELAHGHTQEAGYQDGCGYRHSMMDPCGPVPEGRSTRSDFWEVDR